VIKGGRGRDKKALDSRTISLRVINQLQNSNQGCTMWVDYIPSMYIGMTNSIMEKITSSCTYNIIDLESE
jgi:hypothetical protein